jgi:hypothetical protein
VPVLFGPAAVSAPEVLESPAAEGDVPMPVPVPVVPGLIVPPLFVPLAAGAPELEPPPAEPPELCASAKVGWLMRVRQLARWLIVSWSLPLLVSLQA